MRLRSTGLHDRALNKKPGARFGHVSAIATQVHRQNRDHDLENACCAATKLRSEIKAIKLANEIPTRSSCYRIFKASIHLDSLFGKRSAARTRRVGIGIVWMAHRGWRSTLPCVRARQGDAELHAAHKLACRGFAQCIPRGFSDDVCVYNGVRR